MFYIIKLWENVLYNQIALKKYKNFAIINKAKRKDR